MGEDVCSSNSLDSVDNYTRIRNQDVASWSKPQTVNQNQQYCYDSDMEQ